jgi:small redox-active disulfide protein 2
MKVEIMGPGCPRCETTEKNARQAVANLGLEAEVEHIYDVKEYARRGVVLTPAVVVDGEVKVSGRVPTIDEIEALLGPAGDSS